MSGVKKDVVAKIGTYYDGEGNEKNVNRRVGKIIETKNGYEVLVLDAHFSAAGCMPAQDGSVYLSLFEPDNGQQSNGGGQQQGNRRRREQLPPRQDQSQGGGFSGPPSDDFSDELPDW